MAGKSHLKTVCVDYAAGHAPRKEIPAPKCPAIARHSSTPQASSFVIPSEERDRELIEASPSPLGESLHPVLALLARHPTASDAPPLSSTLCTTLWYYHTVEFIESRPVTSSISSPAMPPKKCFGQFRQSSWRNRIEARWLKTNKKTPAKSNADKCESGLHGSRTRLEVEDEEENQGEYF